MLYNETNWPVILHSVIFYSCYKTVLSPFRKGYDFFFFSNGHEFFSSFIFAQFYIKSELPDEQISRFGPHSCTSSNYLALAHKMWSQSWCRNMVWTGSGGSRFLFYLLRVYGVSICMDIGHNTILCCAAHKSGRYWGVTARRVASVGRIMTTSFL